VNEEVFYSQNGEDSLIISVFDKPGYFVELGAVDGIHLSNTYALEQHGWTGLLVEAHPEHFAKLAANRPNSTSIHAAVSDKEGETNFYATQGGSLSTIDEAQKNYFIKKRSGVDKGSYTKHKVRSATTTTLLDEASAPHVIDVMSIDIEGAELAALRGLDFNAYDVKLMIVEKDLSRSKRWVEEEIRDFLISKGYRVARRLGVNDFWAKEPALEERIRQAPVRARLANGRMVDMLPGENSKKRGFWKRIKDSYKKRFGQSS